MVTNVKRGSVVGLATAQAWKVGSDGYAYGTAGEGAANDTTTHALLLRNPQSAQLPTPTRVVTPLTGGNRWLGQVMFGISEVGSFPLVLEDLDLEFQAMAGASAMDTTTNARWRRGAENLNLPDLPQLGLMLSTIYQSREDGSDGVNLYVNYIIPRCQIQVPLSQMAYQAENPVTCTVSPTMSSKEPTGKALTPMGLNQDKAVMYVIVTPKPLALTTYIGDGTETTFILGYKPSSSVVTLNNTPNEFARNGVLQALTSVNTSTAVATMAAAGAAGDKNICLYETDFLAVA